MTDLDQTATGIAAAQQAIVAAEHWRECYLDAERLLADAIALADQKEQQAKELYAIAETAINLVRQCLRGANYFDMTQAGETLERQLQEAKP